MAEDRLLNIAQAAAMLNVGKDWFYRDKRWKNLPFTVVLGPRKIRFSVQGIQRYIEAKQNRTKEE